MTCTGVSVHWLGPYQSFSPLLKAPQELSASPSPFHSWQRYENPFRMFTLCSLNFHLHIQAGNNSTHRNSWPRALGWPAETRKRRNFNQRLLTKNQARVQREMAACRAVRWTFFAPLGKKFFPVLLFEVGNRSLCESVYVLSHSVSIYRKALWVWF